MSGGEDELALSLLPTFDEALARHSLAHRWLSDDTVLGGLYARVTQWWLARTLVDLAYGAYFDLVISPLFRLYLVGPRWGWLGGWYGKPAADACSELSPMLSAAFWHAHERQCEALLWRRFASYVAAFEFLIWLWLLWRCMRMVQSTLASSVVILWRCARFRWRRRRASSSASVDCPSLASSLRSSSPT